MAKVAIICNCIVRVAMIIGITAAAICFGRIAVLWFYLFPVFMGIDIKESENETNKI